MNQLFISMLRELPKYCESYETKSKRKIRHCSAPDVINAYFMMSRQN